MTLEVRDPAVAAVGRRAALEAPGVARLHERPSLPGPLGRHRGRGVEVDRVTGGVVVTVRLVLRSGATVIDVVRTVQRSVAAEIERLTGLTADVVVVVVDLE